MKVLDIEKSQTQKRANFLRCVKKNLEKQDAELILKIP